MEHVALSRALLVLAAFLASSVEMVEALTIVLAVGVTRGWRSTLIGVAAATVALAAVVAVFGPALTVIPIDTLRLVVGALLLVFGLQWLRKAILRAAGFTALHDEGAIFSRETEEVAFIVVTFGSTQGSIPLAAVGAGGAVVLVGGVGALLRTPLTRVPENTMKFAVGAMLTSFGTFWGAEGAGVSWPGSDAALLGVLGFVLATSLALVGLLRRMRARSAVPIGDAEMVRAEP